jgi:hypothetical protein
MMQREGSDAMLVARILLTVAAINLLFLLSELALNVFGVALF